MSAKIYHFPEIRNHTPLENEQSAKLYQFPARYLKQGTTSKKETTREYATRVSWGILMRVRKLLQGRGSDTIAMNQAKALSLDRYVSRELLDILSSASNREIKDHPNYYRAVIIGYEAVLKLDNEMRIELMRQGIDS